MIFGLDSSTPPSAQRAPALAAKGYSFYCVYIGGNTPYIWRRDQIQWLAGQGFSILPIWVAPYGTSDAMTGASDGADCLLALQARALSGTVALDVENGAVPRDYVLAFVAQLNNAGYKVCLYGSTTTLTALGKPDIVDLTWLSYWPSFRSTVPSAPYDWDCWQFTDGAEADLNVARDDFPFATLA